MRPRRLLPSLGLCLALLAPATTLASPASPDADPVPPDPFRLEDRSIQGDPAGLPDPFSRRPAAGEPASRLKNPFVARAPRCPVRTTDGGVVIQRPSSVVCEPGPDADPRLPDPFVRR
jgi:hypothetical protein